MNRELVKLAADYLIAKQRENLIKEAIMITPGFIRAAFPPSQPRPIPYPSQPQRIPYPQPQQSPQPRSYPSPSRPYPSPPRPTLDPQILDIARDNPNATSSQLASIFNNI